MRLVTPSHAHVIQRAIGPTNMMNSSTEEKLEAAPSARHQETLSSAIPDDNNNSPAQEQKMTVQTFFAFLVRLSIFRPKPKYFSISSAW
jgi:hypothetical protein